MQLNAYLSFDGQCADAFGFYAKVLNGTLDLTRAPAGSPLADQMPPGWGDRVLHARLAVGESVLMGSDCPSGEFRPAQGLQVNIGVDDEAEAERIFGALSEGATVQMPLAETFWARRFGMLVDRYGTPWMVNCLKPCTDDAG
ncbi:VOC family protein [Dokdonella koreensis]|uniref:Glyoxalase/bleomycin resistance protein/dioxygenase n=1 Tax=Dokdonella koreensis DS-123 TaxID=1300342 RepID=A0A160DTK8_9GAMM|nr:VOC family protein [Dokdonella koreensis]ANB17544.1 Glyoxalase/bleomycin resistance protein/dioxygenase [Dokdonella koreensis DS-123]